MKFLFLVERLFSDSSQYRPSEIQEAPDRTIDNRSCPSLVHHQLRVLLLHPLSNSMVGSNWNCLLTKSEKLCFCDNDKFEASRGILLKLFVIS